MSLVEFFCVFFFMDDLTCQSCIKPFFSTVDDPHLSLPHMDSPSVEEVPMAPPQLEGEAAAMRPSLTSSYSKQFQKSLPPRFLRQQVTVSTFGFVSY